MPLDKLDKETRAALEEIVKSAVDGNDAIQRMLPYFADDGDKSIRKLIDQAKDLAESIEEIDQRIATQERTFSGQLNRVRAATRGEFGRYRGAFGDEQVARSVGLVTMGFFGSQAARDALKAEFPDVHKTHERALTGNVFAEGGALVAPAEILNTVLWLQEQYGVFASRVSETPMGSSETVWTKDTGEPFMNVRGELEQAVTENTFQLERASLKPREWYSLFFYPRTLEEDAAVSIADLMARRFAWAFAYWTDKCGFMGDGTSAYLGVTGIVPKLKAVGTGGIVTAAGVTNFANVTDAHLLAVQGLLPQYADSTNAVTGAGMAEMFCHRQFFFNALCRLARATGGFTAEEFANRRRLAYNGSPVTISQVLPKVGADQAVPLVYGDLDLAAKRGVRRQLQIEANTSVRWLQGQVAVMATMRHDIIVTNVGDAETPEALTALKLAA